MSEILTRSESQKALQAITGNAVSVVFQAQPERYDNVDNCCGDVVLAAFALNRSHNALHDALDAALEALRDIAGLNFSEDVQQYCKITFNAKFDGSYAFPNREGWVVNRALEALAAVATPQEEESA